MAVNGKDSQFIQYMKKIMHGDLCPLRRLYGWKDLDKTLQDVIFSFQNRQKGQRL